ncbi:hypothetical protein TVAG_253570 [Trichomonas vaginalis G3]|uniref:Importin N-terminal domain-containing protein n=1 Tax=Trichomonas vaginalis (strain ATCC PRA-98 / G3) TaxID=412133 RepID=A2DMM4_TRIV3|nr:armadillo (ARM) repeat-containing protein family [Trichomonas vaginalis G3]EAY18245.1 hypothetical protein TVAG_253570 [Trichomonas vaginalis G3]KAI5541934.1 armadillo (ARM) repeat-containing protein family [Trichomonas vaginalis G3]|eukprot:XP_001579231.1 hypothetical protein [Trichomonas vaginalis G3]
MDKRRKEIANEEKLLCDARSSFEQAALDSQNGADQKVIDQATEFLKDFEKQNIFYDTVLLIIQSNLPGIPLFIACSMVSDKVLLNFDDIPISKIDSIFQVSCSRLKNNLNPAEEREQLQLINIASSIAIQKLEYISQYYNLPEIFQINYFNNLFDYLYCDHCSNFSKLQSKLISSSSNILKLLSNTSFSEHWLYLFRYFIRINSSNFISSDISPLVQKISSNSNFELSPALISLIEECCSLTTSKISREQIIFINLCLEFFLEVLKQNSIKEQTEELVNARSYVWNLVLDINPEFYILTINQNLFREILKQFLEEIKNFDTESQQFHELIDASSNLVGVLASQKNSPFPMEICNFLATFLDVPDSLDMNSKTMKNLFKNLTVYNGKCVKKFFEEYLSENGLNDKVFYALSNSSIQLREFFSSKICDFVFQPQNKVLFMKFIDKFALFINFMQNGAIFDDLLSFASNDLFYIFCHAVYKISKHSGKNLTMIKGREKTERLIDMLPNVDHPYSAMYLLTAIINFTQFLNVTEKFGEKISQILPQTFDYVISYSIGNNSQEYVTENFHIIGDFYEFLKNHLQKSTFSEEFISIFCNCFVNNFSNLSNYFDAKEVFIHETITRVFLSAVTLKWCPDNEMIASYLANSLLISPIPLHFDLAEEILDIQPHLPLLGAIARLESMDDPMIAVSALRFSQRLVKYNLSIFFGNFSIDFVSQLLNSGSPRVVSATLSLISLLVQMISLEDLEKIFPLLFDQIYNGMVSNWTENEIRLVHRIMKRIAVRHTSPDNILNLFKSKIPVDSSYFDDFANAFADEGPKIQKSFSLLMKMLEIYRKPIEEMYAELGIEYHP